MPTQGHFGTKVVLIFQDAFFFTLVVSCLRGKCYKYGNINGIRPHCTFPVYRAKNSFCLPGGLGFSHNHIMYSQGWLAPGGQAKLILLLPCTSTGPTQGDVPNGLNSPHPTSFTSSKCSSLSLVEASSRHKAAFSELKLLRQNRDR